MEAKSRGSRSVREHVAPKARKPRWPGAKEIIAALPPKREGTYYVYVLRDPVTGEVRYVGISHCVGDRYRQHLGCPAKSATRDWIRSLAVPPEIELIHGPCSLNEAARLEEDLIVCWLVHRPGQLVNGMQPGRLKRLLGSDYYTVLPPTALID